MIEDMKYFPFMFFCINRRTQDTNIYLCSKEVFLANQQGKLSVKSRAQGKREAFVEINGKSVGTQGIIFLNDETENIGFRAGTPSGAVLEVETRMKPVDFKDVVLSDDKKSLILTASGAEPVNEDAVKKLSEDDWQFQVDAQRPILYLKGEGDIPLRQEFYVKGAVPTEALRPTISNDSYSRVYKENVQLVVKAAPGTVVSSGGNDQKIEKIENSQFRWSLEQIPSGRTSRHYLRISDNTTNTFLASYDIYRDYAFEIAGAGAFGLPANQFYGLTNLSWWMENFLGAEASWSRLHWGLRGEQSLVLNKKDGEPNLTLTHLEMLWRANSGFHFVDATWGLLLPYEVIQASGVNTSSLGFGGFYSARAPKTLQKWLDWYDAKFIYLLGGSGDVKLKNALQLGFLGYSHVDKRFSWNYGASVHQYSFDPGQSKMQFQLIGGANYRF